MKDHSLKTDPKPANRLDGLNESQLLDLRVEIDSRLHIKIADMDLTEELGLQYQMAKILLNQVQTDNSVPPNQRALVFNAVREQLTQIVKMQETVWSMERLKRYEAAFKKSVETFKNYDDNRANAMMEVFMDLYGDCLNEVQ